MATPIAVVLVLLTLTGCGVSLKEQDWKQPVGRQWAKDSYECEIEARNASGKGGMVQKLWEKCLLPAVTRNDETDG